MWKIWWAPNNASKWQMGFNSAFEGLKKKQGKNVIHVDLSYIVIMCSLIRDSTPTPIPYKALSNVSKVWFKTAYKNAPDTYPYIKDIIQQHLT